MDDRIRRVGFVGLGIMGGPMAANLLAAGFELSVWNRTAAKAEALGAAGAVAAGSLGELVAAGPEVVCLCLTGTRDVQQVLFGEGGLVASARRGLIVVDHSTIDPAATRGFARRLEGVGLTLLDAPVSGGDSGARAGTLSVMVGGEAGAFARCRPLFDAVGARVTHLGPAGMGQGCKACNQVAVVNALVGVCEALRLAGALGLDRRKMLEVVGGGAGGSWQLANLGPKIVDGDFEPGFTVDDVLKDLGMVGEVAAELGVGLEATAAVRRMFEQVRDDGGGALGTQALGRVR